MPTPSSQPQKDGIYLAILWVLAISTVLGAALLVVGATLLHAEPLVMLGAGITVTCGGLLLFFRWLGRRNAARAQKRSTESKD